jgi:hypothetical protein
MTCANCATECDGYLCNACQHLATYGTWNNEAQAARAREEMLTNRRWQMRFVRGELQQPADIESLVKEGVRRVISEYGEVLRRLAD